MGPLPLESASNLSPNARTILSYFSAVEELDVQKVLPLLDDRLEYHILPKSLARPMMNKKQYGEYFIGVMPVFRSLKVVCHELIEVEKYNRVIAHISMKGLSSFGTPYDQENMLIYELAPSPDGEGLPKILFAKEFVDSTYSSNFFKTERQKLRAARSGAGTPSAR